MDTKYEHIRVIGELMDAGQIDRTRGVVLKLRLTREYV